MKSDTVWSDSIDLHHVSPPSLTHTHTHSSRSLSSHTAALNDRLLFSWWANSCGGQRSCCMFAVYLPLQYFGLRCAKVLGWRTRFTKRCTHFMNDFYTRYKNTNHKFEGVLYAALPKRISSPQNFLLLFPISKPTLPFPVRRKRVEGDL